MPDRRIWTRDKNLIALQTEILGAAALNITAVLAVTGDAVKRGPEPAKPVFEGNSLKLIELISQMNRGKLMSGEELEEPMNMLIGVAYNPNAENINRETERLLKKIEAGAHFAETQPVHSKDAFNRCVEALAKYDISQEKFPVIFGLMPIISRRNGEFLNNNFSGIHINEDTLKCFDGDYSLEDRLQISYEQTVDLATHFAHDGTNNYYIICPFKRYDLTAKIVEYIKFGYSSIYYRGTTIVDRDPNRKIHPITGAHKNAQQKML
jgi:5,10-methylenetetrahydrofolate reductase